MKIAMLIDWRTPIFGWGQVHVKYLSELLVKNHDCKVDLFVRKLIWDDGKKYTEDEHLLEWKLNIFRVGPVAKFFDVPYRIISLFLTTLFLLYKTIKEKYNIIHAHAYVSWLPAKIVWVLTRTPVVYTVHGTMWLDADKKWVLAKIERRLICGIKYDLEISVSHKIFDYQNINKNIIVQHNWVDIEKFDSVKVNKKYDWINFLRVGRFDRQKWLEFLIEWINQIDRKILEEKWFKLNLVWDGELLPKIKELVQKYKLSDFVNFKWKIFWDDLIVEYKKNHIFILPSLAEWQPLTLLEAMASKLLVIVTDVGDNKYFVKNLENWYIIPPWDALVISNAIEKDLNSTVSKYNDISKKNYNLVANKYTRNMVAKNTYYQYTELFSKK